MWLKVLPTLSATYTICRLGTTFLQSNCVFNKFVAASVKHQFLPNILFCFERHHRQRFCRFSLWLAKHPTSCKHLSSNTTQVCHLQLPEDALLVAATSSRTDGATIPATITMPLRTWFTIHGAPFKWSLTNSCRLRRGCLRFSAPSMDAVNHSQRPCRVCLFTILRSRQNAPLPMAPLSTVACRNLRPRRENN